MNEKITMKPMSRELFVEATRTRPGADVDGFVDALDHAGYWDNRPRTREQKRNHVRRKRQSLRDENGRKIFHYFTKRMLREVEQMKLATKTRQDDEWPDIIDG